MRRIISLTLCLMIVAGMLLPASAAEANTQIVMLEDGSYYCRGGS